MGSIGNRRTCVGAGPTALNGTDAGAAIPVDRIAVIALFRIFLGIVAADDGGRRSRSIRYGTSHVRHHDFLIITRKSVFQIGRVQHRLHVSDGRAGGGELDPDRKGGIRIHRHRAVAGNAAHTRCVEEGAFRRGGAGDERESLREEEIKINVRHCGRSAILDEHLIRGGRSGGDIAVPDEVQDRQIGAYRRHRG